MLDLWQAFSLTKISADRAFPTVFLLSPSSLNAQESHRPGNLAAKGNPREQGRRTA
jgi:hypothetical protein